MKTLAILLIAFLSFEEFADAQSFSIGTAAVYGDDIKEAGINIRGMVQLNNPLGFVAEYTAFNEHNEVSKRETESKRLWEINLNAEYNIHITKHFGIYPLVGLNFSAEQEDKEDFDSQGNLYTKGNAHSSHHEMNKVGLNLGGGLHYEIGHFEPFIEYGHLFSALRQNLFSVGFMYHIGKLHGHHAHNTHKPHTTKYH